MLTGELPLGRFAPPSRKVQIDVRLDQVVLRALEKEPERRYQQASEVKTEVETIGSSPSQRWQSAGAEGKPWDREAGGAAIGKARPRLLPCPLRPRPRTAGIAAGRKTVVVRAAAARVPFPRLGYLAIPFSILWAGFAFAWETAVIVTGEPLLFPLFGSLFVAAGSISPSAAFRPTRNSAQGPTMG